MENSYSVDTHDTDSKDREYPYRPTQWWSLYKQDMARYKSHRKNRSLFAIFLTEQGLWAILQYRVASAIYRSHLPHLIKAPLLALAIVWSKFIEITTGIVISYQAIIGPGFYIGHFGNIFVGDAILGHTCNISQGVTIGFSGRGQRGGFPTIGNRVYIAANAVVAGKITVGDDAAIAANSLVTTDVAPHTTVMGVPAQLKSHYGSEGYLDPME